MKDLPGQYWPQRAALGFSGISFGAGGIQLLRESDLAEGQVGFSVDEEGFSLIGNGPADWRDDWIVIGIETACGDPLFLSTKPPHRVFTAMIGEDTWEPRLVAPSLPRFWECLRIFQGFALRRGSPTALEANPPSEHEITRYLHEIERLCDEDQDAVDFWTIQAEIAIDDEEA